MHHLLLFSSPMVPCSQDQPNDIRGNSGAYPGATDEIRQVAFLVSQMGWQPPSLFAEAT